MKPTEIRDRVAGIVHGFRDRLPESVAQDIRQQVDFNEWGMALDSLAVFLFELDAKISREECDEILLLFAQMGDDVDRYEFLKGLVAQNGDETDR